MTKFTARTIGTQDTPAYDLVADNLPAAKIEADNMLGDMFRGDNLVIEFKSHNEPPFIAASRVLGAKKWEDGPVGA